MFLHIVLSKGSSLTVSEAIPAVFSLTFVSTTILLSPVFGGARHKFPGSGMSILWYLTVSILSVAFSPVVGPGIIFFLRSSW